MVKGAWLLLLLQTATGQEKNEDKFTKFWQENSCADLRLVRSQVFSELTRAINTLSYPADIINLYNKVLTADLQETNIFEDLKDFPADRRHPDRNVAPGGPHRYHYWPTYDLIDLLQIGEYFQPHIPTDHIPSWHYRPPRGPEGLEGRKGTVEEYVVFMMEWIEKTLGGFIWRAVDYDDNDFLQYRLDEVQDRITGTNETNVELKEEYDRIVVNGLENIVSGFQVQQFLTKDSRQEWNEWTANKLSNVLKDMAFFGRYKTLSSKKAAEDVERGLPGYKDPFTFILETPKVLQSPKVEPVLRMATARSIAEMDDFGGIFFLSISCFLNGIATTRLISPFLGLTQNNAVMSLDQIQKSYEASLPPIPAGQTRDPEPWIDLVDVIIREIEKIDLDELFYELYAVILKTKNFLKRLDYDGGLAPSAVKVFSLLEKPYVLLTSGKWPTMWTAIKEAVGSAKTGHFWTELNQAYKEYRGKHWDDDLHAMKFLRDFKNNVVDTISNELEIGNSLSDLFQLSTTDTGKKYFKITKYLNKQRGSNEKSIFQPDIEIIDIRYFLKTIVRNLQTGVPRFVDHFKPLVSKSLDNIELTVADYGMMKNTVEAVVETITEIMDRVENTY